MFTSCSEKFGPVFPHEKYNYDIRCMHVGQDMILCTYLLVWDTTLTTNSTNFSTHFYLTNCFQTNYTQLGDSVKVNSKYNQKSIYSSRISDRTGPILSKCIFLSWFYFDKKRRMKKKWNFLYIIPNSRSIFFFLNFDFEKSAIFFYLL